uniref:Transmembrane protein 47 n=1 Tax=Rhabditophanes sp. KR3021 TaxID=114890 RepID=A0AC35UEY6_9BILA
MVAQTTTIETITVVRPLKITALICLLISLALLVVALATDYWLRTASFHKGLFRECTDTNDDARTRPVSGAPPPGECKKPSGEAYVNAVIALMIIGGIFTIFALVTNILGLKSDDHHRKYVFYKVATSTALFTVLCQIISLILFPACFYVRMSDYNINNWEFDWSYGIAWCSCMFAFGASLLLICDKEHEEVYYKEKTVYNPPPELAGTNGMKQARSPLM